jgi:hypothetical protein
VIFVLYDFLKTTISLSGLGPISRSVAGGLWSVGRRLAVWSERRLGKDVRGLVGPTILASIAATWITLQLLGYTLMYAAGLSLVVSGTDAPATLLDKIAFSGSALSTLGASIVSPTGGWWDLLSMIAAVNGMIVLTLAVSFILNVLQTTTEARGLAVRCHALVPDPVTGDRAAALREVAPLGSDLCAVAVRISASPLPGMFVPSDPTMNFPHAVLYLCDLLDDDGPTTPEGDDDGDVRQLRAALGLLRLHSGDEAGSSELLSARSWAVRYSLPEGEATASRGTV